MNYLFAKNVSIVLLLSLVFLATAQRREVDMHELERQNKITKQILEAYLQKKLGIVSNVPKAPSILEILPVKMTGQTTRQSELEDDVDEEQDNQDLIENQELPEEPDWREDDSLQSVESEQIDSIYNTQGRTKKYATPPFEADLEPSGYNQTYQHFRSSK